MSHSNDCTEFSPWQSLPLHMRFLEQLQERCSKPWAQQLNHLVTRPVATMSETSSAPGTRAPFPSHPREPVAPASLAILDAAWYPKDKQSSIQANKNWFPWLATHHLGGHRTLKMVAAFSSVIFSPADPAQDMKQSPLSHIIWVSAMVPKSG